MSRFIFSTVAIVGLLALSSGSAFAQHCRQGGGYGGGGYGGYYNGGSFGVQVYSTPSYNYAPRYVSSGYQNYQPSYQNYGQSYYHDTSHYDYHAPSLQRHGNHYDYVPGHYDFHQTGHHHR